jgi:hypothetical protein
MMLSGPSKSGRRRKSYVAISGAEIATAELTVRGAVYPCPANYITIDRLENGDIYISVSMDILVDEMLCPGLSWSDRDYPMEALQLEGNMLRFKTPLFDWDDPDGSFHFTDGTYAVVLTPKGVEALAEILAYLSLTGGS